jgi:hypothetical protein
LVAWLAVPALSYGVTFIGVVGFSYDRFLLPICLILAVFGGVCLDRVTRPEGPFKTGRLSAALFVFVYSALYAGAVDVVMATDSRYDAERWLQEQVEPDQVVGTFGHAYLQPGLQGLQVVSLNSVEHLADLHPDYVIVNVDYFREGPAADGESTHGLLSEAIARGEFEYKRVARFERSRAPWGWLPGRHPDLAGDRRDRYVLSNLYHISPTIEIYKWPRPVPSYDAWLKMPGQLRAWLLEAHGVQPSDDLIGHHLFRWREERVPAEEVRRRIFAEAGKPLPDGS